MDENVKQAAEMYRLVQWAYARRKQIITVTSCVVAVAAIIGIYFWHRNYKETSAAEALSQLKMPALSETASANAADPYIQLANEYSGTTAAARALLVAGGILFDSGKYAEAQKQFNRVMQDYADFSLANVAQFGVAACLESEGKIPDATARYDEFIKRHNSDPALPEAKSALARLYVAQNKPDRAYELYSDVAHGNNSDQLTAEEAALQAEDLLQKYPALAKPVSAMPFAQPAT